MLIFYIQYRWKLTCCVKFGFWTPKSVRHMALERPMICNLEKTKCHNSSIHSSMCLKPAELISYNQLYTCVRFGLKTANNVRDMPRDRQPNRDLDKQKYNPFFNKPVWNLRPYSYSASLPSICYHMRVHMYMYDKYGFQILRTLGLRMNKRTVKNRTIIWKFFHLPSHIYISNFTCVSSLD